MSEAEKLEEFFKGSSTFAGVTFQGMYGMGTHNFILAFQHFIDTGENVLDEHSELMWLSWDDYREDQKYYDEEERKRISKLLENDGFWNVSSFMSDDRLKQIENNFALSIAKEIEEATYKKRRRRATTYTGNKKVRAAVLEKHGAKCKKCGSTDNIHLDHIIPVAAGGDNSIDNLQPLCRSCNSSKGVKPQ